MAQVRLGIDAVELGGADQRVDRRGALAAGVGAGEQLVLPSERDRAQGSLGGVVVDLDAAVVAVARQRRPARQRIADRAGELGLLRQPSPAFAASQACRLSSIGPARAWRIARRSVRRPAADLVLDRVELADALERLPRDGRAGSVARAMSKNLRRTCAQQAGFDDVGRDS